MADPVLVGVRLLREQRVGCGQESGRAEAALQRVVLAKRRLERRQAFGAA